MAFPTKDTRRLVVGGERFLWHVSRKYWRAALATVQAERGGPPLHYWPDSGLPSPAEAAAVIQFALDTGWPSVDSGVPVWVGRREGRLFSTRQRVAGEPAILVAWRAAKPVSDDSR